MSGCNWRRLEADGRVLACDGYRHEGGVHGPMHEWVAPDAHPTDMDAVRVGWHEDDPMAWDATCPDCDGTGILGIDLGEDWGDCDTCGGAGTVDTIPPRIGGLVDRWVWCETHEALVRSDDPDCADFLTCRGPFQRFIRTAVLP